MVYGDGIVLTAEDKRSHIEKCTLYVGNLSFQATEPIIKNTFEHYGNVREVRIVLSKTTGKPNGVAFVQFESPEPTVEAMAALNGTLLMGRPLSMGYQGFKIDRKFRKSKNPYDYFNRKDTDIERIKARNRGQRYKAKWISDHNRQKNQEEVAPRYRQNKPKGRSKDWYADNRASIREAQAKRRAEREAKKKARARKRSRSRERRRTYEIPDY